MECLKKSVVMAVCLTAPLVSNAELKVLEDASLSDVTGRAGITIDIEAQVGVSALAASSTPAPAGSGGITIDLEAQAYIGEIAYRDAGYIGIEDISIGGADRTGYNGVAGKLDNLRITVDVANGVESFEYGSSYLDLYQTQVTAPDSNWGTATTVNDDRVVHGDGDLVIRTHATTLFDGTEYDYSADTNIASTGSSAGVPSNVFYDALFDARNAVDVGLSIGAIKLHDSGYTVGSKAGGTTLISNFNAEILGGSTDIIIENNGDGFTDGVADSAIQINSYFEVTSMSLDLDIAGVSLGGIAVHNWRGNRTGLNVNSAGYATDTFGFAHSRGKIVAVQGIERTKNTAADFAMPTVDGVGLAGSFAGDMDIGHISFGGFANQSIGSIYMTDIYSTGSMIISAH